MNEYIEPPAIIDPLAGRYAGFWVKLIAPCIDLAISLPIFWIIQAATGEHHPVLEEALSIIFLLIAYVLFFAGKWQATPGMRVMKFYATDRDGNRLSYASGLKWILVYLLGVAFCFSSVAYMQYRFDLSAVLQLKASCLEENISPEDCNAELTTLVGVPGETFNRMIVGSAALTLFLILIWSLSVALAKDKSGFHNLLSHTRFLKGRP